MEGVGHNIPNIDGMDSIIRREPPSPVSEWVGFASYAEGRRHGPLPMSVPKLAYRRLLHKRAVSQRFPSARFCGLLALRKGIAQLNQLATRLRNPAALLHWPSEFNRLQD